MCAIISHDDALNYDLPYLKNTKINKYTVLFGSQTVMRTPCHGIISISYPNLSQQVLADNLLPQLTATSHNHQNISEI